jgi:hypothetical protein
MENTFRNTTRWRPLHTRHTSGGIARSNLNSLNFTWEFWVSQGRPEQCSGKFSPSEYDPFRGRLPIFLGNTYCRPGDLHQVQLTLVYCFIEWKSGVRLPKSEEFFRRREEFHPISEEVSRPGKKNDPTSDWLGLLPCSPDIRSGCQTRPRI